MFLVFILQFAGADTGIDFWGRRMLGVEGAEEQGAEGAEVEGSAEGVSPSPVVAGFGEGLCLFPRNVCKIHVEFTHLAAFCEDYEPK